VPIKIFAIVLIIAAYWGWCMAVLVIHGNPGSPRLGPLELSVKIRRVDCPGLGRCGAIVAGGVLLLLQARKVSG